MSCVTSVPWSYASRASGASLYIYFTFYFIFLFIILVIDVSLALPALRGVRHL